MDTNQIKAIVEGLLLAAAKPLSIDQIYQVFNLDDGGVTRDDIRDALNRIEAGCEGHGYELKRVASGYRYQVREDYSRWIARLWDERPQKYSRALLETLSIIAYRQPITRGDIEEVRGVSVSSNIVKTLLEREWVRVVGHRDVPGKPALYATTRQFLDHFNLQKLDDLPPLSEIRDLVNINPELALTDVGVETARPQPTSDVSESHKAASAAGDSGDTGLATSIDAIPVPSELKH